MRPGSRAKRHGRRRAVLLCAMALALMGSFASAALAVEPAPRLTLRMQALPTRLSQADSEPCVKEVEHIGEAGLAHCDFYRVTLTNSGSRTASGPFTLTDILPAGVKLVPPVEGRARLYWAKNKVPAEPTEPAEGFLEGFCEPEVIAVSCTFPIGLAPDQRLEMDIYVTVEEGAVSAPNTVSVSEGAKTVASDSEADVIGSTLPSFGASAFISPIAGADGGPDTQAGAHPYEFAQRIDLNSRLGRTPVEGVPGATSVEDLRDVVVDLPIGFLGSATSTPKCTFGELHSFPQSCPLDSLVGHISTLATAPQGPASANAPVFSMVPERGVAAEFGFRDLLFGTHEIVASVAPTPAGYVLRATAREVPQIALNSVVASFFGDPAVRQEEVAEQEGKQPGGITPAAMFTNPSDCSGQPLRTTLHMDSWESPGSFNADGTPKLSDSNWKEAVSESPPVMGCSMLRFEPEAFGFAPEEAHRGADEPAGYESVLKIPQSETPGTLATPPLKTAVVTLPPGVAISPAAADGLVGCQETGGEGIGFESPAVGHCPAASKVGSVEVVTPLLAEHFQGSVFVAQPSCGGLGQPECAEALAEEGKLFAIYLEIGSENTGVHIKLKGKVEVGGNGTLTAREGKPLLAAGQVRTSFIETPQFPFNELKLKFNGGPRAPLANPQSCGTFTTSANLEPWSAPESGPNAIEEPSFAIGGGCGNGFAPSFSAGTINNQAGAYSAFTTTFSRHGGEQDLSGVTVNMPQGLLGKIAGIARCPEAQANAGTCSSASKIGTATAAAGSGSRPFWQSGTVYLTGPYNGGPFGLSVVVPAVAGPYNLGLIVVRASIRINPATAVATIVSNPLPQSVDGVPLRVQTVNVTVGQENNFTFNATSCTAKTIAATLSSAQGAQAAVSSPYNAANCATLPFKPSFTVSTQGKTSKANGGSLNVKIAYPSGGEANIAKVDLQFPKALPARLTTLQKACTAAQFESNPAGCPAASDIATVVVYTPLLNVPLTGPAYFVSHGGAAFPDVELVLQGEGVTLVVDGKTQIKKGVTFSHFDTTPDAPFSAFEFNAPEGPHSILTANGDLCTQKLVMPTTITGQNGAVINQDTRIGVTGCPKIKKATLTRAQKLARALKACHKKAKGRRRAGCERQARRKYGPVKKAKRGRR